jgi:hypothetical protein
MPAMAMAHPLCRMCAACCCIAGRRRAAPHRTSGGRDPRGAAGAAAAARGRRRTRGYPRAAAARRGARAARGPAEPQSPARPGRASISHRTHPLPIKHCLSTPSDQIWENTRTHEMRVLFLLLLGILVVTQTADASIQNANNIRNNKRLAKECEESYNAWASVTTCSVLVQPPVNNATNAAAPASALVCPATCRK